MRRKRSSTHSAAKEPRTQRRVHDETAGKLAERLPAWYSEHAKGGSFLILPMAMKGSPFAMIYADKAQVGSIELGEKELSLLRTLRNQAVLAFKQSS